MYISGVDGNPNRLFMCYFSVLLPWVISNQRYRKCVTSDCWIQCSSKMYSSKMFGILSDQIKRSTCLVVSISVFSFIVEMFISLSVYFWLEILFLGKPYIIMHETFRAIPNDFSFPFITVILFCLWFFEIFLRNRHDWTRHQLHMANISEKDSKCKRNVIFRMQYQIFERQKYF